MARTQRLRRAIWPAFHALVAALPSLPAVALESLCEPGETIVFSCPIGRKLASVCASPDLSPRSGTLQYRFGRHAALEIALPEAAERALPRVGSGTLTFAGGGGAYLRFPAGDYSYVVYTALIRGRGPVAGVAIDRGGRRIGSLRCSAPATSELGPDFFTQAGLPADASDFDVP